MADTNYTGMTYDSNLYKTPTESFGDYMQRLAAQRATGILGGGGMLNTATTSVPLGQVTYNTPTATNTQSLFNTGTSQINPAATFNDISMQQISDNKLTNDFMQNWATDPTLSFYDQSRKWNSGRERGFGSEQQSERGDRPGATLEQNAALVEALQSNNGLGSLIGMLPGGNLMMGAAKLVDTLFGSPYATTSKDVGWDWGNNVAVTDREFLDAMNQFDALNNNQITDAMFEAAIRQDLGNRAGEGSTADRGVGVSIGGTVGAINSTGGIEGAVTGSGGGAITGANGQAIGGRAAEPGETVGTGRGAPGGTGQGGGSTGGGAGGVGGYGGGMGYGNENW